MSTTYHRAIVQWEDGITVRVFIEEPHLCSSENAGLDAKQLVKKADLCVSIARMMLRGHKFATKQAQAEAVEHQAVALMPMPNADLIATASRLAAKPKKKTPKK